MNRKSRIGLALAAAAAVLAFAPAAPAQLLVPQVVAQQEIPAGNAFAPHTPAGMIVTSPPCSSRVRRSPFTGAR